MDVVGTTSSHTHALETQVGGHAGVLTTEDGSLLIKPALSRELAFYQALQQDPKLAELREFTPKFIGVLKLEGKVSDPEKATLNEGGLSLAEGAVLEPSIVLENLSHSFTKPNIMDIKLGTELYDEDASPEKMEKMKKTAESTTSFETGVRLTGFQVYDNVTGKAMNTPKSYGKTIKASELSEGIARFFPVGDGENSTSGLAKDILIPILQGIREEVGEIRDIFKELEIRMVGGSLLIIYEADWEKAEEGFLVKLIDFAHTRLTPGQGPDLRLLVGLDTVLGLLDRRLSQLIT